MSLLYDTLFDTTVLDLYINPEIIGNILNDRIHFLQKPENLEVINVSDIYKYRPERLALQYYGSESYYPIILAANNIGTLFHFVPSKFNNTIKMVKLDVLRQLLEI